MGVCASKDGIDMCGGGDDINGLIEKIKLLREEVRGLMSEMDRKTKAHEKDMVILAFKEADWKAEKKKLEEQVKILRKMVEDREERINGREKTQMEWELMGTRNDIFDQIREERARRDEAVEKWKQLYHAIKIELDDLIQRTHNRDGLYWGENDKVEELQMELQAKEETIKALKQQAILIEQEKYKTDREIDILRQSLRIITSKREK